MRWSVLLVAACLLTVAPAVADGHGPVQTYCVGHDPGVGFTGTCIDHSCTTTYFLGVKVRSQCAK